MAVELVDGLAIDTLVSVDLVTADGRHHRSTFMDTLTDGAIDAILAHMAAPIHPMTVTQIRVLRGVMADVASTDTAFAHRDAGIIAATASAHDARTHAYFEALTPWATGVYSNFLEAEGDARIRQAYPAVTYTRLAQVKRRHDPTNLFHLDQNIRPAIES